MLDTAETLAAQLAEAARSLPAGYDLDEQAYLASGAYAKELLDATANAGVELFEEDERLLSYPSLVRILPDQIALEGGGPEELPPTNHRPGDHCTSSPGGYATTVTDAGVGRDPLEPLS